ncbi:COX15/CtaA family protein [Balneatrix alpica]|uniref:Heme A synthase n=1 Tax=Balneatrix alpica TaxID=75684 RepID=A0ABV5Z6A8_9GAMM|nr:COX15/CtaA family protein [Balneatrix alpica]
MGVRTAYRLAILGCLLAFVVVTLGALTRLLDAGLGCPDWPGCYGFLTVPVADHHVAIAEARYPDFPVDHTKGWAEMIHRYAAGMLGLLILALAWGAMRQSPGYPKGLSYTLLVVVVVQAMFGMWTVTLKLWPQVVTLHLLGGFTTLLLLCLLILRIRALSPNIKPLLSGSQSRQRRRGLLASLGLGLVIVQIVLGGWTSSNYAAFACPDFPRCQAQWVPEPMNFQEGFNIAQEVGPNYLGGQLNGEARVAIHWTHRVGAVLVTVVSLLVALALWRQHLRKQALLLLITLGVQLSIGIANVLLQLPLSLALAHNTGALALLLAYVWAVHSLWQPQAKWQGGLL